LVVSDGTLRPLELGANIGTGIASDDFPVFDNVPRLNTNGRTVCPRLAGVVCEAGSCPRGRARLIKGLPRLSVSAPGGHKRREQCAVYQALSDEPLHVAAPCTVAAPYRSSAFSEALAAPYSCL